MRPMSPAVPGMALEEVVFAKNQPEYIPLPAVVVDGGTRVVTRWRLSLRESIKLLFTGDLWISVLTFGKPLQPILPEVDSPKRYLTTTEEPR